MKKLSNYREIPSPLEAATGLPHVGDKPVKFAKTQRFIVLIMIIITFFYIRLNLLFQACLPFRFVENKRSFDGNVINQTEEL